MGFFNAITIFPVQHFFVCLLTLENRELKTKMHAINVHFFKYYVQKPQLAAHGLFGVIKKRVHMTVNFFPMHRLKKEKRKISLSYSMS